MPPEARPRTRVLASWDIDAWGQPLALGSLLAYARVHDDGRLRYRYDIRPVLKHEDLLTELRSDPSPAVVLFSDYIWSAERNLSVSSEVAGLGPHLIVHGGPHVPRYDDELKAHFATHMCIGAVAHGEGELTLAEMLVALDGDVGAMSRLERLPGLTVRRDDGTPHRGPDRARHDQLDDFPSPYLSGEFDHLDPAAWKWPSIETNRGCPYSCTFCDWGSATRSRVRFFPMERVLGELEWFADRGLAHWMIDDANFGIHKRDVDITRKVVELRERHGVPEVLYVSYAKNTVKHLAEIISMLVGAGITGEGALALQTRDPATLSAIKRSNIRLDKYDELAEEFRRHGLPLVTDLIIGLPGQTVDSLLDDMQYCIDQDVTPRFFVALTLPNAEFNDPDYRDRYGLVRGDGGVVVASTSFSREDRDRMMRLRMAYRCLEHFGMLRHVLRYLQWDLGIPAARALGKIEELVTANPERHPLLAWVLGYLDIFLIPPHGWPAFLDEVRMLLHDEFGVPAGTELETVLRVQSSVLPWQDRQFPDAVDLDHDYVEWFRAHTEDPVHAPTLAEFGPGVLLVDGDPLFRCHQALLRLSDERPPDVMAAPFWTAWNWELDSPLQRLVTETAVTRVRDRPVQSASSA